MKYIYRPPYENELIHYGIIGMKWGVRRYQNPDGTLTDAGKKRYGESNTKQDRINRYKEAEKKKKELEKAISNRESELDYSDDLYEKRLDAEEAGWDKKTLEFNEKESDRAWKEYESMSKKIYKGDAKLQSLLKEYELQSRTLESLKDDYQLALAQERATEIIVGFGSLIASGAIGLALTRVLR